MICNDCGGMGRVAGIACGPSGCTTGALMCATCKGTGEDARDQEWVRVGIKMREDRKRRMLSQKEEAERRGMRVTVLNDMERGRIEPTP